MKKIIVALAAAIALVLGLAVPANAAKPSPPAPVEPSVSAQYIMGEYVDSTNTYYIKNTGTQAHQFEVVIYRDGELYMSYTTSNISPGWWNTIETPRDANVVERVDVYLDGIRLAIGQPTAYDLYGKNKCINIVTLEVVTARTCGR